MPSKWKKVRLRWNVAPKVWWVCDCQPKCVPGTDFLLTLSGMLLRVSSFAFNTSSVLFLSDEFLQEAVIPTRSPRSELAVTLAASRPEDAFIDLTANSILGVIILSIAVKLAFRILSSTVSTMLPISLSILSLKNLSQVWTFTAFSLAVKLLPLWLTVNFWSTVLLLTTNFCCLPLAASPMITSWSKSSNWLKNFPFDCLYFQVDTIFTLTHELPLWQ